MQFLDRWWCRGRTWRRDWPLRLAALAVLLLSCGDQSSQAPLFDASRQRRVFQPPPGEVRAVPPHAIRSEGVGPYLLGAPLKDILALLPHGPRVELMEIDGVVDYSLVKTESDSIVIGVQRPGVSFVTVLDGEIARTENGVGVGTSTSDLATAMGALATTPNQIRDPSIVVYSALPNARFVIDRDRVVAVLVERGSGAANLTSASDAPAPAVADGTGAGGEPLKVERCDVALLVANEAELIRVARVVKKKEVPSVAHGCFGNGVAGSLIVAGDRMALVAGEPGRFRRVVLQTVAGLRFAGLVDVDGDGRHEVALVSDGIAKDKYTVRVELRRLEGGHLNRVAAIDAYQVSATSAAWIGARLDHIDLLVEVSGGADRLDIGGLYVHRGKRRPENVVPLAARRLVVRRKRPPPVASDDHDAGVAPRDGGTATRPARGHRRRVDAGRGRGAR